MNRAFLWIYFGRRQSFSYELVKTLIRQPWAQAARRAGRILARRPEFVAGADNYQCYVDYGRWLAYDDVARRLADGMTLDRLPGAAR